MDIVRLILSIIFPPLGLLINFISGYENKIQKASMIISTILSIILILLIVVAFVLLGNANQHDIDIQKCRSPYYCEPSDTDTQTCYWCKDNACKRLEKITCVNDGDGAFNYKSVAKEDGDVGEIEE